MGQRFRVRALEIEGLYRGHKCMGISKTLTFCSVPYKGKFVQPDHFH